METTRHVLAELEIAHRNGLRLLKLINTLLDFSRIEAGRARARYEATDLAAFTAELAGTFRSAIERAGLRLMVECPPLSEPVAVDREMWEKIILPLRRRLAAEAAATGLAATKPGLCRARRANANDQGGTGMTDLASIQADQFELRPAPTDLSALLRTTIETQRRAHPDRAITLEPPEWTDSAGETRRSLVVAADADRIAQVVANYLTNALAYSETDQPVTVSVRAEGRMARVAVRDQGPGVPEEERARIWERFERVAGQRHRSGSLIGLGLGLYISRAIIERHGGAVGVESTVGEGSAFWFTLPLAGAAAE